MYAKPVGAIAAMTESLHELIVRFGNLIARESKAAGQNQSVSWVMHAFRRLRQVHTDFGLTTKGYLVHGRNSNIPDINVCVNSGLDSRVLPLPIWPPSNGSEDDI
jgi:hypothetical protein